MIRNLKTKTATHVTPQVYTLEILQQLKNILLLAEVLISGLMFWKQNVQLSRPLRTMEKILGAYFMNNDDFWGNTNPTDVSIDTTNSREMMVESHITELYTHKHKDPVPSKLFNKVPNMLEVCDAVQKCQLDPSDKSKDSNMLSKTNNVTHANGIDL